MQFRLLHILVAPGMVSSDDQSNYLSCSFIKDRNMHSTIILSLHCAVHSPCTVQWCGSLTFLHKLYVQSMPQTCLFSSSSSSCLAAICSLSCRLAAFHSARLCLVCCLGAQSRCSGGCLAASLQDHDLCACRTSFTQVLLASTRRSRGSCTVLVKVPAMCKKEFGLLHTSLQAADLQLRAVIWAAETTRTILRIL